MSPAPLRIVHWGKYYPPEMGGIEVVTRDLAEAHAEWGHRVDVVCFTRGRTGASTQGSLTIYRCREFLSKVSQPLSLGYLWKGLQLSRRADVVHLHAPNLLASLMALFLGPWTHLVVHWHSDIVGKGVLGALARPIEALMLRRADAIICTSEPYAAYSRPLNPWRAKIRCVPIGIPDPLAEQRESRIPEGLADFLQGRRLIFAAGRLVPYKGFCHLIDAAALLPPDAAVAIVGDGPLREELASLIKARGLEGRVRLLGRVSDAEMNGLFDAASLFCLPSVERSEAFGVVILEAMARGVPVLATEIPGSGVPWVNQHGVSGLNVPPGDAQQLAHACVTLLEDGELRERLGAGARARFESTFPAARSAREILNIYLDSLPSDK